MRPPSLRKGWLGFTLVELLVVIAIIALISIVALPVVLPALSERRVSEAARIFQANLAGARDAAIRANAPRGIRLLPDPVFNDFAPAQRLASNRLVPIEPAPDYSEGNISAGIPPVAPSVYATGPSFLSVVQQPTSTINSVVIPNSPTGWAHNIRQGDKIRFGQSGAYYTVAGPMFIGPATNAVSTNTQFVNAERYINYDASPSKISPIQWAPSNANGEYLYLVNGQDDDGDGWVDEGFDGIDNNGDGVIDPGFNGLDDNGDGTIDEPAELLYVASGYTGDEYEQEVFTGAQYTNTINNASYLISRRPVVTAGSREVTLPEGIVIDLTTYNAPSATPFNANNQNFRTQLPERSRVPVDPYTHYVDVMISPSGQVVQAGAGSAATDSGGNNASPTSNLPFYHFWLTDRQGVVAPLWDPISFNPNVPYRPTLNPNYSAAKPQTYLLPMPQNTAGYLPMPDSQSGGPTYSTNPIYLLGERRLVTLFTKSGQIVTNSIEVFDPTNISVPYYNAQAGVKEQQ